MAIRTLQQRITIYLLLPLFLLLLAMGGAGFLFARSFLLEQWGETTAARLQAAAHQIDMRLGRPREMLLLLGKDTENPDSVAARRFIIDHLRGMAGVVQVQVDRPRSLALDDSSAGGMMMGHMMHLHREADRLRFSLPRYDARLKSRTIAVSTDVRDPSGRVVGRVEVILAFDDLIERILRSSWWRSYRALLVDDEGNILAAGSLDGAKGAGERRFGRTPLEKKTLAALRAQSSGTVFGNGSPPEEVSGFHRLKKAPWTLVLIAPGEEVLRPYLRFRLLYLGGCAGFILVVLVFIRVVIAQTAHDVKKVSDAAAALAAGRFGPPLPITSADEVGELTRTFNIMSRQLEDRLRLKEAMAIAKEVQQNLLPAAGISLPGLEIAGLTRYCDETGGDYFDLIRVPGRGDQVYVVVGDVVGHGIGAALLMTTTRALVRARLAMPGSLGQAVADINRLLCLDTAQMGNFVTLFVMKIDIGRSRLHWVRAGHEPAMLMEPGSDEVTDIKGDGVILGVDENWMFVEHTRELAPGTAILIASDGAWDAENDIGERVGRERVKEWFAVLANEPPEAMINEIAARIDAFRGEARRNDDVTLVGIQKSEAGSRKPESGHGA